MASVVSYSPTGVIAKASFNFDASGIANFKWTGTVNVSVSDSFTFAQYLVASPPISKDIYTSLSSGSGGWTATQLANINLLTSTFTNFINLNFSAVIDYSGLTPASVGNSSDINISFIYRPDLLLSGESAIGDDTIFGYAGSRGDIVLNVYGFGSAGLANDRSLNSTSFGFHTLMHEIGHSLGLSHPHSAYEAGVPTLTDDYAATVSLGFDRLGFHISSPLDMYKEYFSVMSYDDQKPAGAPDTFAQTPMILDVIALQHAYGEGRGSSGSGNDEITPGGGGAVGAFRTYFDTGGSDTINLANYAAGAYLHMGTTIVDADHLVGVSMSVGDANAMIDQGKDPSSLRWFYGEYENAIGSSAGDVIIGNTGSNLIDGGGGSDTMKGGAGDDTYVVDNAGDIVSESAGEGDDTVQSSIAYVLGANLENLTLTGTSLVNGTGNALANRIAGNLNNNTLSGGAGDDTYVVQNAGDIVVENLNEGADLVLASVTYALAANIENLTLTGGGNLNGTANGVANILIGNAGMNILIGGSGNDTLDGGAGFDQAIFSGNKASYTVAKGSNGSVTVSGPDGVDTLTHIEKLVFGDGVQKLGLTDQDFNGDGKSDLVGRSDETGLTQLLLVDGVGYLDYRLYQWGPDWKTVSAAGDMNGDGKSDLIGRSDTTGLTQVLLVDGVGYLDYRLYNWGSDWKILSAKGDFNGDGKSDIVGRSDTTGLTQLLLMNGVNYLDYRLYEWGPDWKIVSAEGDFNGDGKSDLVGRSDTTGLTQVLLVDGVGYLDYRLYEWGADWKVVSTEGDFNGDGKSDLVGRSDTTGLTQLLLMDGVNYLDYKLYNWGPDWKIISAAGDFNGDGKSDLVGRSDTTGLTQILLMDGVGYLDYRLYNWGPDWKIVSASQDFNGDGKSDLVGRSDTTGLTQLLLMDGVNYLDYKLYSWGADWKIVNEGDPVNQIGGTGNDHLYGGPKNDILTGGLGNDTLTGGGGSDRFVYRAGESGSSNADHITDFTPGPRGDVLDIKSLLTGYNPATSQLGDFVQLSTVSGSTQVYVDGDGPGTAQGAQLVASLDGLTGLLLDDLHVNHNLLVT